jgi:hypothetical protein
LRVTNHAAEPLTLTVPNGVEHSPYWVHSRAWKPKKIEAAPGRASEWTEVGSLLDAMNDGSWELTPTSKGTPAFEVELGEKDELGAIAAVYRVPGQSGKVRLTYYGDTRYRRAFAGADDRLYALVDLLKAHPPRGTAPVKTSTIAVTFGELAGDERFNAASRVFERLMGINLPIPTLAAGERNGYFDLRDRPVAKLAELCKRLQGEGTADAVRIVSMGDEIGLPKPPADGSKGFRAWLKAQKVSPGDVVPGAGADYGKIDYRGDDAAAKEAPALYAYSRAYQYRFGIAQLKERTDVLRACFRHAGIGANYSPHIAPLYMGTTHQWISLFREGGLTMPWGEDYTFQVPVLSAQVNELAIDIFRAGVRNAPDAKILYYVMPHAPNNTPGDWRRQFYADLGHGMKLVDLFDVRPVEMSYTENSVSAPAMFLAIRDAFYELGTFEDLLQEGRVAPGVVALWFSEAGDVWSDRAAPFDAAERSLYVALRQRGLPIDVVVEGDPLQDYRVLYVTDRHVSRAATKAIGAWVKAGGRLVATLGAGAFDELDHPNTAFRALLGVAPDPVKVDKEPLVELERQDLPFAKTLHTVRRATGDACSVYGATGRFAAKDAEVVARFEDGSPAVSVRKVGAGFARYLGFLPGLSYFHDAIPKRPTDRGATDDAMAHFLPESADPVARDLLDAGIEPPIASSSPTVGTRLVTTKNGAFLSVVNWSHTPARALKLTTALKLPPRVTRASGQPVTASTEAGTTTLTLDLDVADAIVFR